MVQPGVRVVDETGTPSAGLVDTVKQRLLRPRGDGRTVLSGEALAASLLRGNWLYWPSLAFRRKAVVEVGFRDELPIIQDFALELDLVARGGRSSSTHVCFLYRRHAGSASATTLADGTRFADERATTRWPRPRCAHWVGPRGTGGPRPAHLTGARPQPGPRRPAPRRWDAVAAWLNHAITRS